MATNRLRQAYEKAEKLSLKALGYMQEQGESMLWYRIGPHDEYERRVRE